MLENKTNKQENLIFDVGIHKGEDTDFYLKKGFSVVGFDANPTLITYCREKFSKEIKEGRLILIEGAITDSENTKTKQNTINFYRNLDDTVWGTVSENWAKRNEKLGTRNEIIEVPVINFSDYLRKYGIPYYLKIDIEGMDKVCLKSLLKFEQKPSYISIESEKISFTNLIEELELFIQLGYNNFKAVQQSGISRQKEPNPVKEGCKTAYQFKEGSSGLFGRDLSGDWKTHKRILKEYKKIFFLYEYFGDMGKWRRKIHGRILRELFSTILQKPIPGWYDTHAKHDSVQ